MRRFRLALTTTAAFALAGWAIAHSTFGQASPNRAGSGFADPEDAATPTSDPTSILVAVRLDARGVELVSARPKPELRYRQTKGSTRHRFAWTLRDAGGVAIARGGFDPGPVDLAPENYGRPPRALSDDRIVLHEALAVLKIPDLAGWKLLDVSMRRPHAADRVIGSLSRSTVLPN